MKRFSVDPLFVIMEYVRFGKLQTYLRESRPTEKGENAKPSLTSLELTKFAYQVARGMEYLSSKVTTSAHSDCRRILLEDVFRIHFAKVAHVCNDMEEH